MIRGRTIEISLQPILAKDLDETERSVPVQIDLRNVRYTDAGNVKKRNGYTEKWDTTAEHSIKALIPIGDGYAIDAIGSIYKLGSSVSLLKTLAPITIVPQHLEYGDSFYLLYGSTPIKITGAAVELINQMPRGRFISQVGGRTVVSGHHPTRVDYSAADQPENWTITPGGAGFFEVEDTGDIKSQIEYRNNLFYFKPKEIEVYSFTGVANAPFRLQSGLKIDKGLGAMNSVVKANDRFYWFGNDGDFYEYSGGVPLVISDSIRARLDEMNNTSDLIGLDIRKENIIMWISQTDGMSLIYDYSKKRWLEDNRWSSGWQSLPFLSYMELNRKQYFGSVGCDGKIHEWSKDYKDDNGTAIKVYRRLKAQLSRIGHRTRVDRIRLRRKGSVATSAIESPVVAMRWRFDKGKWSKHQQLSLGAVGEHNPYIDIRRLGIGVELELEITESSAVDYLLTDMLVTFQEFNK
jgi:hypothetical protein